MSNRFYLSQLDGFRAVAILVVIVGHEMLGGPFHELAAAGVLLFFVLSGFLITTLLLREEEKNGRIGIGPFYVRRALRILPAVYVFLLVCAGLVRLGLVTDTPWSNFAVAVLYLRNVFGRGETLAHLWSLSLEEQFYLVWPAFFALAGRSSRLKISSLVIVAVVVWRAAAMIMHLYDYNLGIYYERTDFRFDSILVGCALAFVMASPTLAARVRRIPALAGVAAVAVLALTVVVKPAWFLPFQLTVQTLCAVTLLAFALQGGHFAKTLSSRPLRFVGRISYSWYLWQQIFIVTKTPSWGWLRTFPVDVFLSLGAAVASHYLIERPFLRLKDALPAAHSTIRLPGRAVRVPDDPGGTC